MSAKKAAKKSAKKAAKKSAHHHGKHHGGKHHGGKDLRRAYEHLGRLSVLEQHLDAAVTTHLKALTDRAQASLHANEPKSAADLLRAAEHLVFGSLAATAKAGRLSEDLEAAINADYEHMTDKAEEHWEKHAEERPAGLDDIYDFMRAEAEDAFGRQAFRRALEFARGAEALAHVRGGGGPQLEEGGPKRKKLKA